MLAGATKGVVARGEVGVEKKQGEFQGKFILDLVSFE